MGYVAFTIPASTDFLSMSGVEKITGTEASGLNPECEISRHDGPLFVVDVSDDRGGTPGRTNRKERRRRAALARRHRNGR